MGSESVWGMFGGIFVCFGGDFFLIICLKVVINFILRIVVNLFYLLIFNSIELLIF